MSTKDYGGPAFPTLMETRAHNAEHMPMTHGMTLRDYFAAKAMHAVMVGPFPGSHDAGDFARHAYEIADAMLAERAK